MVRLRSCPGCGIEMPASDDRYGGTYHASAECWSVFGEVQALQYGNVVIARRAHQLTVDAYAVQHAGGSHPDKSVAVHLGGLHLVIERGRDPLTVPPLLQRLAGSRSVWPRLEPPSPSWHLTILDVALAPTEAHVETVGAWASEVWMAWESIHGLVAALVAEALG